MQRKYAPLCLLMLALACESHAATPSEVDASPTSSTVADAARTGARDDSSNAARASTSAGNNQLDAARAQDAATTGSTSAGNNQPDAARTQDAAPANDAAVNVAKVPAQHRATGSSCPTDRAAGVELAACSGGFASGACYTDADCSAGVRGRCQTGGGPACRCDPTGKLNCSLCTYDTCSSDADCPTHEPCWCRTFQTSPTPTPNTCATGSTCRVDADCGASGYCSPSQRTCAAPGDICVTYYCHTPHDLCTDDSDCAGTGTCNYDTTKQLWACGFVPQPL